jgi:3-phosphoglycerate kinase
MQGIKHLPRDLNIKGKRIITRLDLNVPLKDKIIQDFTRIEQVLTFLQNLIERKAKVILISHLGRPKGIRDNTLSLLPIYKYIKKKLNTNMYFYTGEIND